jgi:hypothetical protein
MSVDHRVVKQRTITPTSKSRTSKDIVLVQTLAKGLQFFQLSFINNCFFVIVVQGAGASASASTAWLQQAQVQVPNAKEVLETMKKNMT